MLYQFDSKIIEDYRDVQNFCKAERSLQNWFARVFMKKFIFQDIIYVSVAAGIVHKTILCQYK